MAFASTGEARGRASFPHIDLLWSEGAAYNIGFANALTTWAAATEPGGCAVVSELMWLREEIRDAVRAFFRRGYPVMRSLAQNITVAENAGYKVLTTFTLPPEAWGGGYYDVLETRATALLDHPEPAVLLLLMKASTATQTVVRKIMSRLTLGPFVASDFSDSWSR
jgi:hypothetical protein